MTTTRNDPPAGPATTGAAKDELLRQLAWLDSTVLSDALDFLGLPPGIAHLTSRWGSPRMVGVVRTVELEADTGGAPGPHIATRAIATAGAGDVLVVANGGREDVSCWGGLLSLGSIARGVVGVVADGACRDVAEAEALGFPVYARAVTPRTARGRLRERACGERVQIAGVAVDDGDLVLADDSGVVFVPRAYAAEVIARAQAIVGREAAIAADVRRGAEMAQAMHDARLAGQQYEVTAPQEGPRLPVQARLSLVPTAAVSDALDRLGLPGSLHGLGGLREGQSACGPAFTARYEPVDDSGGTVGDFLDDVPAGAVVVIDNGGSTTETVWGGIMTRIAAANGVAGTVINGVCRDTAASAAVGYSTWSAGRFMRTGKDRVRLHAVQEPVSINGVTIRPGDVVVGDDDGVVVVPVERAEEVAELAERIEAVEAAILTAVAAGSSLTQARREHGYHALQTRDSNQVTA
ncbi:hypothetical protein AB1207_22355 [Kineococcus endophyticus]|uniref:Putative 4-hydroxy-4-methyl-2-oxoglutarate aldolase n=2 Tax=Kineococcus endophyticus TaxID=1181883 RepID=A0ABV3PCX0_9ACTN